VVEHQSKININAFLTLISFYLEKYKI